MKTKIEKINIEIAKRNKLFKGATKAQKRVLIAKDVLQQLRSNLFEATSGVYADTYHADGAASELDSDSLQVGLLACRANKGSCEVCAKGALVLSKIMFSNKVATNAALDHDPVYRDESGITAIFSEKQLNMIEAAFEQGVIYGGSRDCKAASLFLRDEESAEKRLVTIMRNVIRNGGTFVLPKRCFAEYDRTHNW